MACMDYMDPDQSSRMDIRKSDMSDVFWKCLTLDSQKALLFK